MSEFKLLNHQFELFADTTTKIIGLVSGYGGGKTYAAARKAIQLAYLNAGEVGIVTEPNYPMLRDIFIPELKSALEEWGVNYKFNAADSIFFLTIEGKETKIICKSMENYERLVGINAAWIICDEFDTSKMELAYKAYQKLLGRLRAGNVRQFIITTTPEGFKATYKIFVQEGGDNKRLIQARTEDNKYLPLDFVETLKAQYPPNLLEAYLNGKFINLASGTVYSYFNRRTHHSNEEAKENDTLFIGQDFNVGGCVSTIHVIRGDKVIRVDEIESKDTFTIPTNIRKRYPTNKIVMFPDASGKSERSNATKSDIQILRDAGFIIEAPQANGRIIDRVNAVNGLLSHGRYLINTNKCPKGTEALEQQVFDKNGDPEKFTGAGTIDDYNDSFSYYIVRRFPLTKNTVSSSSFPMR